MLEKCKRSKTHMSLKLRFIEVALSRVKTFLLQMEREQKEALLRPSWMSQPRPGW